MQAANFEEVLEKILRADARYHQDAYFFLREALDFTQKNVSKARKDDLRHVTGQELLGGIRDYALAQFGPMAVTVLAEWGIHSGEDFGEMVFTLVENNLLAATATDTREDFKNGYDFDAAFRQPYLPTTKIPRRAITPAKPVA